MKRKSNAIRIFILLALSLLSCFVLFGCDGASLQAPEVKDVAITAADADSYGKAGALHRVTYTVPDGCEVTTSVQLGGKAATATDYSYLDGGYYFYTAGEYTVTVYAAKDGMLGSASAKLTVVGGEAFVGGVQVVAAAGETYGKAGALHLLKYSAASGSEISVSFKKDGEEADDVQYDDARGTIVFGSAGEYVVTVTSTLGTSSAHAETQIEIIASDPPAVELTLDKKTAAEDEAVTIGHTVSYARGDNPVSERVTALYRKGKTGAFRETDAYTVKGDLFIPHLAGEWRVVYTATGTSGATGEGRAELTCTPAELSLAAKETALQRIQTGVPVEIGYLVTGAADKYNVSFDTHGNDQITAEPGDGYSVRITSSVADYATVTVTYTHKVTSSVKKTLDINFYSVENLLYAPVWGEDPFDGMPADVLTCMGHLLYLDATAGSGAPRKLTAADAKFEVTENNVTATSDGTGVDILYAAENTNYPYMIVSNFDANVATGSFTLKATVTDPYTGYSAVAKKTFTVNPTTNNNDTASARIAAFVAKYPDFYHMGKMDLKNVGHDCRMNMVLTKDGVIMHRTNQNWGLNNGQDFALIEPSEAVSDCRLDFTFVSIGVNASGSSKLGIGLRTVTQTGWVGFLNIGVENGRIAISNELGTPKTEEKKSAAEMPAAEVGEEISVRLERRTNGTTAEYTVLLKTSESGAYVQCYRCTYDVSTLSGEVGSPIAQYQFSHRGDGGCYTIKDVRFTELA